jgi:hypothetical protein
MPFVQPYYRLIDRSLEINQGLLAAFVPASSGGKIPNLVGIGGDLTLQSSATYTGTPEGFGLKSTAVNTGGASVTLPPVLKLGGSALISLYWRGFHNGLNAANSNVLIGAVPNNAAPFFDYCITTSVLATSDIGLAWNTANTSANSASTITPTAGTIGSYGGTFTVGGNAIFYVNGVQFDSTAFGASGPTYQSTDVLFIGGFPGAADGRTPNVTTTVAYIWNRVLSAKEMLWLHQNPFGVFAEDNFWTFKAPVAATPSFSRRRFVFR